MAQERIVAAAAYQTVISVTVEREFLNTTHTVVSFKNQLVIDSVPYPSSRPFVSLPLQQMHNAVIGTVCLLRSAMGPPCTSKASSSLSADDEIHLSHIFSCERFGHQRRAKNSMEIPACKTTCGLPPQSPHTDGAVFWSGQVSLSFDLRTFKHFRPRKS